MCNINIFEYSSPGDAESGEAGRRSVLVAEAELGEPVVALLEVQVLEAVGDEVEVGGRRVEVVLHRDAQVGQVQLAVGRGQILQLGRRHFPDNTQLENFYCNTR